jgi:hypothetical protein
MDLRKVIDENVECVDTPNGKYLNRAQVFESIKLVESKLTTDNKQSAKCCNNEHELEEKYVCKKCGGVLTAHFS